MKSMDQALHHGLKVLVLSVNGEGETATATVGAHGFGAWEVAVADLVPLDPPSRDRLNRRDEATAEKESYRAEQRRKRAERGEHA